MQKIPSSAIWIDQSPSLRRPIYLINGELFYYKTDKRLVKVCQIFEEGKIKYRAI